MLLDWGITKTIYNLEKDQVWQMPESRITIVGVGRHLTHFKHCKTHEQKRVTTQVETISHLQDYLRSHRGKLVEPKPPTGKSRQRTRRAGRVRRTRE